MWHSLSLASLQVTSEVCVCCFVLSCLVLKEHSLCPCISRIFICVVPRPVYFAIIVLLRWLLLYHRAIFPLLSVPQFSDTWGWEVRNISLTRTFPIRFCLDFVLSIVLFSCKLCISKSVILLSGQSYFFQVISRFELYFQKEFSGFMDL